MCFLCVCEKDGSDEDGLYLGNVRTLGDAEELSH